MQMILRDCCDFYSGTGFPEIYQGNQEGDFPFFKVGDISSNVASGNVFLNKCENYVSQDVVSQIRGTIIPSGTIVFAKIGEALKKNRRAITKEECLVDNNAMGIAPHTDILRTKYFYYFMCALRMEKYAEATAVPSVRKTKLETIPIQFPSIEQQIQIENRLDTLNNIVVLRKLQLRKLDSIIKARFVEMFGKCKRNVSIKNSGLIISDGNYSSKYPRSDEFVDEGIPFIRANNMKNGTIVDEDMYYITPEKHSILLKGHLHVNDVLVSTRGNIGIVAIVPERHKDSNINAQIVLLRDEIGRFAPHYLLWALQTEEVKNQFDILQTGTALKQLPVGRLEQVIIQEPPLSEQQLFSEFAEQVDKSKVVVQKALDEAQLLFDSLMQQYFG